jgi:hypothetical protein
VTACQLRMARVFAIVYMCFTCGFSCSGQQKTSEVRLRRLVGLEYPWFARLNAIQGDVELVATVSGTGSVENVAVRSGPPPLAIAAKANVSKWVFGPCASGGVACEVHVVFSFVLSGSCDASSNCPSEFTADLPDKVTIKAMRFNAIVN